MPTLLARLFKAVHTVPLLIARPLLFWWAAHKRRSGAWRVRAPSREAQNTRSEPAIRALQADIDCVRALREFEALVRNWSSASLADLRSRMAVVLADRSSAASLWIAANSIDGPSRHGPGIATRLPTGSGAAARAAAQRSGRHLGMSRFNWADGGFNSTSAPA